VVLLSALEPVAQRVEGRHVGGEVQDVAVLADRTRRADLRGAETSTTKWRMSPSWPIALGVLTCAAPIRVIATSQNTPGSLSGASFLPAHLTGIG
jgi:hypothetical protein